ncbi:hypothetical protein KAR02_04360 [Candidatus Bipolaricaulota bacterium]|nr:hypothetical protein [Candidatus Bipolaricaulota bacterium]
MRQLRVLGLSAATILTAGLGIGLILAGSGVLSLSSVWDFFDTVAGSILVILVGVALLLVTVHFLIELADERSSAALFHYEGDLGRIDLAPIAVKEFIAGILQKDIGLDRFRISLRHNVSGVGITVRTTLSPDQRVTEVGERIQRELAKHVADRTGVDVSDVTVLVRSIRSSESGIKETSRDETDS